MVDVDTSSLQARSVGLVWGSAALGAVLHLSEELLKWLVSWKQNHKRCHQILLLSLWDTHRHLLTAFQVNFTFSICSGPVHPIFWEVNVINASIFCGFWGLDPYKNLVEGWERRRGNNKGESWTLTTFKTDQCTWTLMLCRFTDCW